MTFRRGIKKLFGLHRITLRDLTILVLTFIFLGFLVILGIIKIMETSEKYNPKYYDPKDFQREELLKKQEKK